MQEAGHNNNNNNSNNKEEKEEEKEKGKEEEKEKKFLRAEHGPTKGNTRGPRGHKKNAKCKTIKRTSNRSTNIKSSHLNSRRYGKKGEKKECKIQNHKKALQSLHQHRISKKIQKEKD